MLRTALVCPNHDLQWEKLRDAILIYLRSTPSAADTVEGVLACWLPKAGFEDAPSIIEDVLAHLIQDGFLAKRALSDGRVLYYLSRQSPSAADPQN